MGKIEFMIMVALAAVVLASCAESAVASEPVQFNKDVRPILSEYCFQCHGPDEAKRKADLRIDVGSWASSQHLSGSDLVERITTLDADVRMPPTETGKRLSKEQIELLCQWIAEGAKYEKHWAYMPPKRPPVPKFDNVDTTNPIDGFVLQRLHQDGGDHSPRADRRTLIRRVYFNLVGLPPSPAQIQAFVNDRREAAFESVVEELLAAPQYGEHMAQSWLDLARYADTTGFAADKPRTMWLYRDWVINAFNKNMPFDQFTIEQLAGDILPGSSVDQKVATGFHRNSMQALGNNPRKEEFRIKGIVDRLDTTGRVWLGSTLACAECHDHKYDPITQREYYELFAIFNNIPHLGEKFEIHGPRIEVDVPDHGKVVAQVMQELPAPRETHVLVRGNFQNKGARVFAGVPAILGDLEGTEPRDRLEFARWLVNGRNPLVARVFVNRVWAHFFGTGIVRTVEDFGSQGEWPSHPELLDWLAVEFVESGWDVQHIQKLIVLSATYQQSSKSSAANYRSDPNNRLLARGPRHRFTAEQIRDNALAVSGLLNVTVGGPSVYPEQPSHIGEFRDDTAGKWITSSGSDRHRRSLYTFWQRMYPYPSMQIFDAPSRERCIVRRERSNTPLQALVLLNDPAFAEATRAFAKRITSCAEHRLPLAPNHKIDSRRLAFAFECALGRLPSTDEDVMFLSLLERQRARASKTSSHNASTELEAWTLVASTLLNLDEAMSKQ